MMDHDPSSFESHLHFRLHRLYLAAYPRAHTGESKGIAVGSISEVILGYPSPYRFEKRILVQRQRDTKTATTGG